MDNNLIIDKDFLEYDMLTSHLVPHTVEENIKAEIFGPLGIIAHYKKPVSLSFDTLDHNPEASIKIWIQLESPEMVNITSQLIANQNNFDLILTFSEEILKECPHSKKFIFGTTWLDLKNLYLDKRNEISYIMTGKYATSGHKIRHEIWNKYSTYPTLNKFNKNFLRTPPRIEYKNIIFNHAKYSIAVENTRSPNYITEKVIDCFLSKTIPIYYGCPNIGDFFNDKGILSFSTMEELENIINHLDDNFYEENLEVIEENYNAAKPYINYYGRVDKMVRSLIF